MGVNILSKIGGEICTEKLSMVQLRYAEKNIAPFVAEVVSLSRQCRASVVRYLAHSAGEKRANRLDVLELNLLQC
jgi:hypothetical protein